jgi:ankyrin repeat protein
LIEFYEKKVLEKRQDPNQLETAEFYQRRRIKHAEEWNQTYTPQFDLGPMQLALANILHTQGYQSNPEVIVLSLNSFPRGPPVSPTRRMSESLLDPHIRLEQSEWYYIMVQSQLEVYRHQQDQKFLDDAEKLAKRCFKIRLEFLRNHPSLKFEQSVKLLMDVLALQKHSIEAEVYRTLYLKPSGEVASQSPSPRLASMCSAEAGPIHGGWGFVIIINGHTSLARAVEERDATTADAFIGLRGEDVNATDSHGKTPLLYAIINEDERMVCKLTDWGADVDAPCGDTTALHEAIKIGSEPMVRLLLKLGAGIEVTTAGGMTPLFYALREKQVHQEDIVHVLCDRGPEDEKVPKPKMDAKDGQGLTVLHHAVRNGNDKVIEILLRNGADCNIGCKAHGTPLHYAIKRKQESTVELLLRHDANVDSQDEYGRTPLVLAAIDTNTYQLIKMLLDHGATVDLDKLPNLNTFSRSLRRLLLNHTPNNPQRRPSRDSVETRSTAPSTASTRWRRVSSQVTRRNSS